MLIRPFSFILLLGFFQSFESQARNNILMVGSSTVYPFASTAAEEFGRRTKFQSPIIESLGTGGGFKIFCSGVGINRPDINNASRRIKAGEIRKCQSNGVNEIIEMKIGYDGVVMVHFVKYFKDTPLSLSFKDIFLALAKNVPVENSETLIPNPYKTWKDVNPRLPDHKIQVYGPPPTSGTRDTFVEIAMEGGCNTFPWIKKLKEQDKTKYKGICHGIRESGSFFVVVGENDNLTIQKLKIQPHSIGIMGFAFLDNNLDIIKGISIEGKEPSFENIAENSYPLFRPLYLYVKKHHIGSVQGIEDFMNFFIQDQISGEEGVLADKGLIPLSGEERESVSHAIQNLEPMDFNEILDQN